MNSPTTIEELHEAIQPLVGMPITRPWQGFGSAICLELGELSPPPRGCRAEVGQASILIEWDWRVEHGMEVKFGSSQARPRIQQGIATLLGTTIRSISVVGKVPELELEFSNGDWLRTMLMTDGRPQWQVKLPTGEYTSPEDLAGEEPRGAALRAELEKAAHLWQQTSKRWGARIEEPTSGRCDACRGFVRLDGDGHLIQYGLCASRQSPFDGRAVKDSGGCSFFTKL